MVLGEAALLGGADSSGDGFGLPFAGEFGPVRRHEEPVRSPAFGLHSLPASRRLSGAIAPYPSLLPPLIERAAFLRIVNPRSNDGLSRRGRGQDGVSGHRGGGACRGGRGIGRRRGCRSWARYGRWRRCGGRLMLLHSDAKGIEAAFDLSAERRRAGEQDTGAGVRLSVPAKEGGSGRPIARSTILD
jgi:hypothetical protein